MDDLPKYEKWKRADLETHAYAMYHRLQQMHEEIAVLQCDVKTATEAYRYLLRRTSDDWK